MHNKYTIEDKYCQLLSNNCSHLYSSLEEYKTQFGLPPSSIFLDYINEHTITFLLENYDLDKSSFLKLEKHLNKETVISYLAQYEFTEIEIINRLFANKLILNNMQLSFKIIHKYQNKLVNSNINVTFFYSILKNSLPHFSNEEIQKFNFKFLNKFYKIFEYCSDNFSDPLFNHFYKKFLLKKSNIYMEDLFLCHFDNNDKQLLKKILHKVSFLANINNLLENTNILTVINKLELFDYTDSQYLDIFNDEELKYYKYKIQQIIIKYCYRADYKIYSNLIFLHSNYLDRYYFIIDECFYKKYINYVKDKKINKFFEKYENLSIDDISKQKHLINLYFNHFFNNIDFYIKNPHILSIDIFSELNVYNKSFFIDKNSYIQYVNLFFEKALPKILDDNILLSFLFCDFSSFFTKNEYYTVQLNKSLYSVNYLIFLLKNYWLLIQHLEVNEKDSALHYSQNILIEFISDLTNNCSDLDTQEMLNYIYTYLSSKSHSTFLYYLGNIFQESYYKFLAKLKKIILMKYKPQPIILSYQDKNLLSLSFDIFNYDFINLKLHLIPAYLNYYLYEKSYNLYFAKYLLNHAIHREYKKYFLYYYNIYFEEIKKSEIWLDVLHSPYFNNKELSYVCDFELTQLSIKNSFNKYSQHVKNYYELLKEYKNEPPKYLSLKSTAFIDLKNFITQRHIHNGNVKSIEMINNDSYMYPKYFNINNIQSLNIVEKKEYINTLRNIFHDIDASSQHILNQTSFETLKNIIKNDLKQLDFSFIAFFTNFNDFTLFENDIIKTINKLSFTKLNNLLDDYYFLLFIHNINILKVQEPIFNFDKDNIILLDKLIYNLKQNQMLDFDFNYIFYLFNLFTNKTLFQNYLINSEFSKLILDHINFQYISNSNKIFKRPYSKEEIFILFKNNELETSFYDVYKIMNFINNNFDSVNSVDEFKNLLNYFIKNKSMVSLFLLKVLIKKFNIHNNQELNKFVDMNDIYLIYENFYLNIQPKMNFFKFSYIYQLNLNLFKDFYKIDLDSAVIDKFLTLMFKKDLLLLGMINPLFNIENPLLYVVKKYNNLFLECSSDYLQIFNHPQINHLFNSFQKQLIELIVYLLSNVLNDKNYLNFYNWLCQQKIFCYKKEKYLLHNLEQESFGEKRYIILNSLLNNSHIIDTMEKTKFTLSLSHHLNESKPLKVIKKINKI